MSRCELAEGTVRPGGVVVPEVFGQHLAQMVLVDAQQPVEDLAALSRSKIANGSGWR